MDIGERIRNIRKSKGLSIYKLAQETGISQNHISDQELGRRKPSVACRLVYQLFYIV